MDQIATGSAGSEQETPTYSGMRGNIILFLADHQDRIAEDQNKRIERIERRLTLLEGREQLQ